MPSTASRPPSLAGAFRFAAARFAAEPALEDGDRRLTYAELDQLSSRLATALARSGVRPGDRVGVALERGFDLIVAILAIVKNGAAYVPLDSAYPRERLALMIEETAARRVICRRQDAAALPASAPLFLIDERKADELTWYAAPPQPGPDPDGGPEQPVYVIFTSGSTGRPKGVEVPQRGVLRLVNDALYMDFSARLRIAQLSNISFDAATFEIWGSLLHGGTLVFVDAGTLLAPPSFKAALERGRIDALFITTALFNQLVRHDPAFFAAVGQVLFGGERSDAVAVRAALSAPPGRLVHVYGPTECTTFATYEEVVALSADADSVPIGKPIGGTLARVLGPDLEPMAEGEEGQLFLGGAGLALGYLKRPALTAEAFRPDPRSGEADGTEPGARLYRTGDLVRQLPGGALEFAGRIDHQVKVRGFRIELGEIEAALARHPAIAAQAVESRRDASGTPRLIAYLVPRSEKPTAQALRAFLGASLPDYMVPTGFQFMDQLPLTPNGKLDRRALPAFDFALAGDDGERVAPRDELETELEKIFAAVLGAEQISVLANFFELGGHSLLAIQLLSRLRDQLAIELPMRVLFDAPTVAGIAAAIRGGGLQTAEPAPRAELAPELLATVAPLSFAQTSLYFLYRLQPGSAAYNQPLIFELRGEPDLPRLARAIDLIVARHGALRTRFVEIEGTPFQLVTPADKVSLQVEEVADDDAAMTARITQELYRPFDLAAGPVQRVSLFRRSPGRYVFLWNTHHIVTDGWSMGVVFSELSLYYPALAAGQPADAADTLLEPLPLTFADVARRQDERWRSGELQPQVDFWRAQLSELPAGELPGDFLRPAVFSYRGAAIHAEWPAELTRDLKAFARKSRSSLFTVLLTAWKLLLSRWLEQDEVALGIPQGGREELEHEGMVGFFVNMLVVRTRLPGDPSFEQALAAVRASFGETQQHAEVPFEKLVAELQPRRDASRQPFFQTTFQVLPGGSGGPVLLGELELSPFELNLESAKFDLSLTLQDRAQGMLVRIEYATDLYRQPSARFVLESLRQVAEALVARPELRRSELPVPAWEDRPRERPQALSYAQQRMFFLSQWDKSSPLYNIPFATRWRGAFDAAAFEDALAALCGRHEVLRCRYLAGPDGGARLEIDPPGKPPIERIDLTYWPAERRGERMQEEVERLARLPFDLSREWPLHLALLRLGDDDHVVSTVFHHIAFDGWSFSIFLRELGALLAAGGDPARAGLVRLPYQYADYAEWQRRFLEGGEMQRQLAFWRDRLLDFEGQLELPADRQRPARTRHRGNMVRRSFDPSVSRALAGWSQSRGATSFLVHLAAWAALLSRLGRQRDLAIGVPVAGRHRAETEGLIGFFVNTLVLRLDLGGDPRFAELVDAVRERALDAFAHQDLPFEKLVEELRPERDPARNPFFQVIFQLLPGGSGRLGLGGLEVEPIAPDTGTAKFDLNLTLLESETGMEAALEHDVDLFDAATVERWLDTYQRILRAVAADPGLRLSQLPLIGAEERARLLGPLRGEKTAYPRDANLAELFAAQAARRGDAPAVVYGERTWSYRELDAASARVAAALSHRGIGYGDFVGVFLERSPEMIAAILGVIRAGAAYAPFDLAYPPDRLAFMIEDTATRLLLTAEELLPLLPEGRPECLEVAALLASPPPAPAPAPRPGDPLLPAYVIYTSGSTGRPKGVVVPQRAILRLLLNTNYLELSPDDRFAQVSNASFDAATFEIWGALLGGGQLIGIDKNTALQAGALAAVLIEQKISPLFLTSALFQQIASQRPEAFRGVRYAFFGGERTETRPVQLAFEAGGLGLANIYGPTECTTFAVVHKVVAIDKDAAAIPIGRAISNTETLVLDPALELVPIGSIGELYLGGDGLAHGYHRRPALTARAFVPHPYAESPGERLYRTGDLVRRLPSGELEFVGRVDFQVKLRGFRIELGEIEAALARHPAVSAQVVLVREDEPGDRRLVAYVQRRPDSALEAAELRAELKVGLPDFMVPSDFVVLDRLPLTPNGKVDRRSLPAPDRRRLEGEERRRPSTPLERLLARVWADVLGASEVFLDDNFFELGGHSLLATKVFARLTEALGTELPLHLVFEAPAFEAFAAAVLDHLTGLGIADDLLELLEELETMSEEEKKALLEG